MGGRASVPRQQHRVGPGGRRYPRLLPRAHRRDQDESSLTAYRVRKCVHAAQGVHGGEPKPLTERVGNTPSSAAGSTPPPRRGERRPGTAEEPARQGAIIVILRMGTGTIGGAPGRPGAKEATDCTTCSSVARGSSTARVPRQ